VTRGGRRPGAGRPVTTGRGAGPALYLRLSVEEAALVDAAAGGVKERSAWARAVVLAAAKRARKMPR
jgi:hypothetical protein